MQLMPLDLLYIGPISLLLRGMSGLVGLFQSFKLIAQANVDTNEPGGVQPRFLIVLPVLREQVVFGRMIEHFLRFVTNSNYVQIIIVTAAIESIGRQNSLLRADDLVESLSKGMSKERLCLKFRGVLPRPALLSLYDSTAALPREAIGDLVAEAFTQWPETQDLVNQFIDAHSEEVANVISHYTYPESDATMARQINYAVQQELQYRSRSDLEKRLTYVTIYNADSQPSLHTLKSVIGLIKSHSTDVDCWPQVIQQSALFAGNIAGFAKSPQGYVLRGLSLLQTRWTLTREIPRLIRQSRIYSFSMRHSPLWYRQLFLSPLGHCVGHGLFIRLDLFEGMGGVPTSTVNEDLPLGYCFSARRIPIYPLPCLEIADSPDSIIETILQKKRWFWSYLQYPMCRDLAEYLDLGDANSRLSLLLQGLFQGLAWLMTSPCILATLLLVFIRPDVLTILLVVTAISLYYILPFWLILTSRLLPLRGTVVESACCILGGIIAYLTDSIGPWLCCFEGLIAKITRTMPISGKTER